MALFASLFIGNNTMFIQTAFLTLFLVFDVLNVCLGGKIYSVIEDWF